MKRNSKLALLLVLVMLATVFVACNKQEGSTAEGGSQNMIMATGGTTGTYYSLGGTLAQLMNSNAEGVNITAQSTGASVENCRLLATGEAELALLQNDVLDYAYSGTELFDAKIENLRAVASLYPEVIQIVGTEDIKTLEDLKGKKVSVGAAGSGTEANARQILNAAGITYDDIQKFDLSFSESADAFKDGQIDAFFVTAGVPNASIQDITAQHKISIIEVGSDIAADLIANYPFYIEFNIPGGTYPGVDEDVNTVAVLAVLATNAEESEDTIYNITKALYENLEDLANSHAKGKEIVLEKSADGISIPFHPGAEKYLKEAGVIK
ncbi:MAG: TAXI family TRAP transporter solute-binding subunit [Bacillota bacterium]|nr:TAXI family TRAP transporter solute-binding subunit [Bacillota bacterium]